MLSEHTVQLFDDSQSLGRAVARFFQGGISAGESLLLIARPAHVEAIAGSLAALGTSFAPLVTSGRLTVLDAADTLRTFMYNGRPRPRLFDETVGSVARDLAAASPAGLRAYGELVDVLAADDNIRAAGELEDYWNLLAERTPIRLHCGYASTHFASPRGGAALRAICERHQHVHRDERDLLANWLLARHACA